MSARDILCLCGGKIENPTSILGQGIEPSPFLRRSAIHALFHRALLPHIVPRPGSYAHERYECVTLGNVCDTILQGSDGAVHGCVVRMHKGQHNGLYCVSLSCLLLLFVITEVTRQSIGEPSASPFHDHTINILFRIMHASEPGNM